MAQYIKIQVKKMTFTTLTPKITGVRGKALMPGVYNATKNEGSFYFLPDHAGWISTADKTKAAVITAEQAKDPGMSGYNSAVKNLTVPTTTVGIDGGSLESLITSSVSSKVKISASTRMFGQPFQFNETADVRIDTKSTLGRKYTETIIAEAPIVYIVPGRASYLPDLDDEQRSSIASFMNSTLSSVESAVKEDILGAEQRYFEFIGDYTGYMNYVNALCRAGATYLGIGDLDAPVTAFRQKYRHFDWKNYKFSDVFKPTKTPDKTFTIEKESSSVKDVVSNAYEHWIGAFQYTQFYVDPSTSFQESTSNQSGTSTIQSMLEKAQSFSKEAAFMGSAAGSLTGADELVKGTASVIDQAMNSLSAGIFSKFFSNTKVIVDGGNITFPEIWGDSSHSKSYNITMNLVSPYGDKESIYLHILVPLFHLMCLSAPRQLSSNSYGSPFLVKVSAKGWFNCELGMVESISVEKVQGSYSVDGMPTEVTVSLSVKDLYSTLPITPSTKPGLFFENKALVNWLAVTCGINIAEPAFAEKWKIVLTTLLQGALMDIPDNTFSNVVEGLKNVYNRALGF